MRLLILGGTVFLGRHIVDAALADGHDVTMFNRGRSGTELFPEVERLVGDRDGDLAALARRSWDAVIDTCGYVPRVVGNSARLLADAVGHYTFVSSISVYHEPAEGEVDEDAPVGTLDDESVENIDGRTYGPLKALCEQAVESAMPGRALIVRPGLIVGPHDPSDRFTYWPWRIARGGDVLAPGRPDLPVRFIDGRDLAEWIVKSVAAGLTGVYNADGPATPVPIAHVLETCLDVSGSDARLVWAPDEFLLAQDVAPFIELPLWIPAEHGGPLNVSVDRAMGAGLAFRPLAETVRDTLDWDGTRPSDIERRAGMSVEKELSVLAAYRAAGK